MKRLGIGTILAGLASSGRGRPRDARAAERVLFGLVANRVLAPSSKLAASEWMSRDVHIDGLGEVTDDACYRAMDWPARGAGRAGGAGVLPRSRTFLIFRSVCCS